MGARDERPVSPAPASSNASEGRGQESALFERLRATWQGRVSGCQLGKAVERLSIQDGHEALQKTLRQAGALPLRAFTPAVAGPTSGRLFRPSCRGEIVRSEPDDDINYTVLALQLLEDHGLGLETTDVARAWLRCLPVGWTFPAERAAFKALLAQPDQRGNRAGGRG